MSGFGFSTNPNCYVGDHDLSDSECLACGYSCEDKPSDDGSIGPPATEGS